MEHKTKKTRWWTNSFVQEMRMRQQDKIAFNLEITVSTRAHVQCEICTTQRQIWRYQMEEITTTLLSVKRKRFHLWIELSEWMKGSCHRRNRGRQISPSLPSGDVRFMKLNSEKRSPGRNLREQCGVRCSGTTSRGTAFLVFCLRIRQLSINRVHFLVLWNETQIDLTLSGILDKCYDIYWIYIHIVAILPW